MTRSVYLAPFHLVKLSIIILDLIWTVILKVGYAYHPVANGMSVRVMIYTLRKMGLICAAIMYVDLE